MAVVTLDKLSKFYERGQVPAVDAVSLEVRHGEFMVLLGPSGCGKTTTLRMIAGLEPISSGTLSIDGRLVNKLPAKDRDIAMVFQSYALYPHMSVADNLAFGLKRRSIDRAEIARRVAAVADTLGLGGLLDRKPHALSGGQRQRVALGRAIVRDPKVFLFDEPLSNLDASLRVSTRGEIGKLHRRLGATMIYVTHDQVEAMTLGQRICIMNGGRIVQVGAPLEVYKRPANTFVASFLGNPPMNLLPARIRDAKGRLLVKLGEDLLELAGRYPAAMAGAEVTLGIRPENIATAANAAQGGRFASVDGEIVHVEALGAETIVTARIAGLERELLARLGPDADVVVGARRILWLDRYAIHLFDAAGARIATHGAEALSDA
jgi:multiple sugar transport system ATP-binding protein